MANLKSSVATEVSTANTFENQAAIVKGKQISEEADALAEFSSTLSGELQNWRKRDIIHKAKGGKTLEQQHKLDNEKLNAAQYEFDTAEEQDKEYSRKKLELLKAQIKNDQAEAFRQLSPWGQVGYAKAHLKSFNEQLEAKLNSFMKKDKTVMQWNGVEYTPEGIAGQPNALHLKKAALETGINIISEEAGVLNMSPEMLEEAGTYEAIDKVRTKLAANWEKQHAIDNGFQIREQAYIEFRDSPKKNLEAYLLKVAGTQDKYGKQLGFAGAWDEAMSVLKSGLIDGSISEEDLEHIKSQRNPMNKNGLTWGQTHEHRWDRLENEVEAEKTTNLNNELAAQKNGAKQVQIEFNNWKAEEENKAAQRGEVFHVDQAHLEVWQEEYRKAGGQGIPDWIKNEYTVQEQDDDKNIEKLEELRAHRGYLIEADLRGMSSAVKTDSNVLRWLREDKDIPASYMEKYQKRRDSKIRSWVNTATGESIGEDDTGSDAWTNAYWKAQDDYESEFELNITSRNMTPRQAHDQAMITVKERFYIPDLEGNKPKIGDEKVTNPMRVSPYFRDTTSKVKVGSADKEIKLAIRQVNKYVASGSLGGLDDVVLPGSEKHLEAGKKWAKSRKGEIPWYYKRVAEHYRNFTAEDLLDWQLKASGFKQGLGDKRTDADVALHVPGLEELQRRYSYKPTKAGITQQRIDNENFKENNKPAADGTPPPEQVSYLQDPYNVPGSPYLTPDLQDYAMLLYNNTITLTS